MPTQIEDILQEVKGVDERLAKRLEPIQKALDDNEKTITEQKAINDKLTKQFNDSVSAIEDLRKLVKATQQAVHTPGGKYCGNWATEEQAKRFGLAIVAKFGKNEDTRVKARAYLEGAGMKALAESTTSTGGALTMDEFVPSLIILMEAYGVFRREANVVPMGAESSTWPKLTGDVTVYAPGEAGTITPSNPTFSNVKLVPEKLAALVAVSSELDEDAAVSVGEIVGASMARAMAKGEDQAGFLGDGTSTYWRYVGLTGAFQSLTSYAGQAASSALGGLVTGAGNAYSELTIGNFRTLKSVLPSYAEGNAKWYASKRFYWEVMVGLLHAAGGMTKTEMEDTQRNIFLGSPFVPVDVMPKTTANSQICAFYGDLKQAAFLGNRRSMEIKRDDSVYFATDQIGIRATERIGLNVFGHGTTTAAGPICALIMYAS